MRLNIVDVKSGEHIIKNKRRKAGNHCPLFFRSYTESVKELMKFIEASLKPEIVFAEIPDNVTKLRGYEHHLQSGEPG